MGDFGLVEVLIAEIYFTHYLQSIMLGSYNVHTLKTINETYNK